MIHRVTKYDRMEISKQSLELRLGGKMQKDNKNAQKKTKTHAKKTTTTTKKQQ